MPTLTSLQKKILDDIRHGDTFVITERLSIFSISIFREQLLTSFEVGNIVTIARSDPEARANRHIIEQAILAMLELCFGILLGEYKELGNWDKSQYTVLNIP